MNKNNTMQEKQYYTPDLTEFHVGFEFEAFDPFTNKWLPKTFGEHEMTSFDSDGWWWHPSLFCDEFKNEREKYYRVKHLDREDIEAEGWKHTKYRHKLSSEFIEDFYCCDDVYLYFTSTNAPCKIRKDGHVLFQGTIRNRSELRMIMKMVGIKQV